MTSVKPIYLVALVLAILFVVYIKVSNPYRVYGTTSFWKDATVESVSEIPDEAIEPVNRNGPVIMWAAIAASDPAILSALENRGADVNESDGVFKGTALTGAAGYTENPAMITELIRLGADINQTVHNDETALMIAAQYNENPDVITTLIKHGAKPERKNSNGRTALDLAKRHKNKVAARELESYGG